MVRIIAGSAKGLHLRVVGKENTCRPTSDRMKVSLFGILGEHLEGLRVLDLFAGSGSLGLEALSRGADFACFIESDRRRAKEIEKAGEKIQFSNRMKSICIKVFPAMDILAESCGPFDIIFADPPYEWINKNDNNIRKLFLGLERPGMLSKRNESIFILETGADSVPAPPVESKWRHERTVFIGKSAVTIYIYEISENHELSH